MLVASRSSQKSRDSLQAKLESASRTALVLSLDRTFVPPAPRLMVVSSPLELYLAIVAMPLKYDTHGLDIVSCFSARVRISHPTHGQDQLHMNS